MTMKLTVDEQIWLDAYRKALEERYPGAIQQMLIYGSKARGDAGPESDLDVLLIVHDAYADSKRELRRIGYLLAATSDAVPSILAYTEEEWDSRRGSGTSLYRAVERDAVRVL